MRVHNVPRGIFELQGVNITRCEIDAWMISPCRVDSVGRKVDAANSARTQPLREIRRDRPRAASDIEQLLSWREVRDEIRGRVLDRPPPVRSQHAVVVAVGIHRHRSLLLAQHYVHVAVAPRSPRMYSTRSLAAAT